MNVLYILNSTSVTGGGTKSFLTLLKGLRAKGVKPFVVLPDKGELLGVLQQDGIKCFVLRYQPTVYPPLSNMKDYLLFVIRVCRWKIWENKATKQIVKIVIDNNIDIIHTNVSIETIGLRAARISNIPHVMHFREYADKDFGYNYFPSKCAYYKMLDYEKSYTISITKGIKHYHHRNGANDRLIYNGISTQANKSFDIAKDEKYFLYAGRIEPTKGVQQVISAFLEVKYKHRDLRLKIAGEVVDNEYQLALETFVRNNNISDDVEFLGARNDIDVLMRSALATVVASRFEAFGRCLPEAMLNGCLTIGHNTAGTKEQYDNGFEMWKEEIGLRYDTTEELARIMESVVDAPADAFDNMKRRAEETVRKLYSTECYIDSVYDFYNEILKNA